MNSIHKNSVVKYIGNGEQFKNDRHPIENGCNYRETACFKDTVNLGAVWAGPIYAKGVPIKDVVNDEKEFYNRC